MLRIALISVVAGMTNVGFAYGQESQSMPPDFAEKMARDLAAIYNGGSNDQQLAIAGALFQKLEVTSDNAALLAGASETAPELEPIMAGTNITAVTQAGPWFGVQVPGGKAGWVNSKYVAPLAWDDQAGQGSNVAWNTGVQDTLQKKIEELLIRGGQFRDAYKDNPYVSVDGFALSVGLTPGLDVNFTFK